MQKKWNTRGTRSIGMDDRFVRSGEAAKILGCCLRFSRRIRFGCDADRMNQRHGGSPCGIHRGVYAAKPNLPVLGKVIGLPIYFFKLHQTLPAVEDLGYLNI